MSSCLGAASAFASPIYSTFPYIKIQFVVSRLQQYVKNRLQQYIKKITLILF